MEDFQKVRLEKDLAELKKLIDTHFAQVCHGLGPNQGFEDGLFRVRGQTVLIREWAVPDSSTDCPDPRTDCPVTPVQRALSPENPPIHRSTDPFFSVKKTKKSLKY